MNKKPNKSRIPQAILIAIIGCIGAVVAAIITIIPSLPVVLPPPLPTGLPSSTPMPTVVGTPITIGADMAASGPIGFVVKVYNISVIVDEVIAYKTDSQGYSERSGYTNLLVKLRVENENPRIDIFSRDDILVVDDYSNIYRTWGNWNTNFPDLLHILYNESSAGGLVYRIPSAALDNDLRLRLETTSYDEKPLKVRIEIPLGAIKSQP